MGGVGSVLQTVPFTTLANGDISHDRPALGDGRSFDIYGMPYQQIQDRVSKWNFSYDGIPGGITATYLGGYDSYDWRHSTSSLSYFLNVASPDNIFLPIRPFIQSEEPITQNHELRFTSSPGGLVTWQAGLYLFKEKNSLVSEGVENPGTPDAIPLLQFNYSVKTQSKAAYAQGTLHFTDTMDFSLGARYSRDELTRDGTFALPVFGIPASPNGDGYYFSNRVTWHAGYDYNWTPSNLLYVKADSGYKPGGLGSCGNFAAEDVTTGEVGSKNRFLNDTLQFNADAFYSDYKNEQVTQFIASCATGSVVTNAGKSEIYGLESSAKLLIQPVGTIDVGFSFLHATYSTLSLPPTNGTPGLQSCSRVDALGNCVLDGNTMVQSPKYVISAGIERTIPIAPADLNVRLEGRYTSKIYFDPFNHADTTQGGYPLINAYVNYKRDNWTVGLFGRNLNNRTYFNYAQEQTTGGAAEYDYSYGEPRVFGVRFEAHIK
jgi:iron complex outermembrane receptor protein